MLDVEENGSKYQALISIVNGARAPVSLSSDVGSRFFKWILTNLQHPLIMPVSRCEYMIEQGKAVTVRRYESKGSLRDQVYRVRLLHSFVRSIIRSVAHYCINRARRGTRTTTSTNQADEHSAPRRLRSTAVRCLRLCRTSSTLASRTLTCTRAT